MSSLPNLHVQSLQSPCLVPWHSQACRVSSASGAPHHPPIKDKKDWDNEIKAKTASHLTSVSVYRSSDAGSTPIWQMKAPHGGRFSSTTASLPINMAERKISKWATALFDKWEADGALPMPHGRWIMSHGEAKVCLVGPELPMERPCPSMITASLNKDP